MLRPGRLSMAEAARRGPCPVHRASNSHRRRTAHRPARRDAERRHVERRRRDHRRDRLQMRPRQARLHRPHIAKAIHTEQGWPVLDRYFRSSDPRVFFVGYPAERRFGPVARFVFGEPIHDEPGRRSDRRVPEAMSASRILTASTVTADGGVRRPRGRMGRARPSDGQAEPLPPARLAAGLVSATTPPTETSASSSCAPAASWSAPTALQHRRGVCASHSFSAASTRRWPTCCSPPARATSYGTSDRACPRLRSRLRRSVRSPRRRAAGPAAGAARLGLIERVESPVLELGAGFDSVYNAHTTSKRRGSNKRRLRQLEELGTVEFARARTEPELRDALEEAFSLHHLRWQGRPDGSDFGTNRGMPFQREAARGARKARRAEHRHASPRRPPDRLSLLVRPRGAAVCSPARVRPGAVAVLTRRPDLLEVLRAAADEGVERVEYLGGDESYKLEFSGPRRAALPGCGDGPHAAGTGGFGHAAQGDRCAACD